VQAAQDKVEVLRARQEVKKAGLELSRVLLQNAEQRVKVLDRGRTRAPDSIPDYKYTAAKEEAAGLQADLDARKAELRESTVRLQQAERRLAVLQKAAASLDTKEAGPVGPRANDLPIPSPPTRDPDLGEQLQATRDEVELLRAQLEVKEAWSKVARVPLKVAEEQLQVYIDATRKSLVDSSGRELLELQREVAKLQGAFRIKKAEEREPEIRLRQAERRLAALEKAAADAEAEKCRQLETRLGELEKQIQRLMEAKKGLERELEKVKGGPPPK
jgi:chromosome segregation ATPase